MLGPPDSCDDSEDVLSDESLEDWGPNPTPEVLLLDLDRRLFLHPPPTGTFLRDPPLVQYLRQPLQKYLGWDKL